MKRIGIVGSRRRDSGFDLLLVRNLFWSLFKPGDAIAIVSGGCKTGGDRFAEIFAKELGLTEANGGLILHRPDRSKLDKVLMKENPRAAFAQINYARNTLVARDSDVLIACVAPDRKGGTEDTVKKFEKMGKGKALLC